MTDEENRTDDPEKPEEIIDEITYELGELHDDLVEGAVKVGEQIERFTGLRRVWVGLSQSSTVDPDAVHIYDSGVNVLSSARDEIFDLKAQIGPSLGLIDKITPASDTTVSVTSVTATIFAPGITLPTTPAFSMSDRYSSTREKLTVIDEALAQTYEEIREVLYGTRSDPERGALFLLRQSYDHFFGALAPDDDVRASPFWQEKGGDTPNLVTREERIQYAASTHIGDTTTAARLASSAKHITDVYRALNRAHERETLDQEKAWAALTEMQTIIETWVEEIDMSAFETSE